ncbi:MAG: OmpA family protein [Maritimibacter sp.]|nr:OmpA family protein [Maritimibacter sp.]
MTQLFLVAFTLPAMAIAQDAPLAQTTKEGLVDALTPPLKLRGAEVTAMARPSIDLAVTFALGSAELSEEAKGLLATVAEALGSDALAGYRFSVAGHTDAVGRADDNLALSQARAQSVKTYLTSTQGIAPDRLDILGFGETRLLFPDAPEDGRNRRVEITTLN